MTLNDDTQLTPQGLLERIRNDRETLTSLWDGLTEEQMIRRPGPQEDWSVKDLIAHITWWESFLLKRVTGLIHGANSEPAEHQDLLNSQAYEQLKDRSLSEVLSEFDASGLNLEALISPLDDAQLNTPAYYRTYDGVTLLPILEAGTVGHYPEHIRSLRAYVEKLASEATRVNSWVR